VGEKNCHNLNLLLVTQAPITVNDPAHWSEYVVMSVHVESNWIEVFQFILQATEFKNGISSSLRVRDEVLYQYSKDII
jgi:hypothetical protein